MKFKKIYKIRLICCLFGIVFIYAFFHIVCWLVDNHRINKNISKISNVNIEEIVDDNEETLINPPNDKDDPYWQFIKYSLLDINFDELKKTNKDTVGWLQINNTNINYPYVQGKDNEFYLNHTFDKSYNDAGWLFLDYRNDPEGFERNNIIYGHSRLNKTLFGTLKEVLKTAWFNEKSNHLIKISTPQVKSLWQIFSVYESDDDYHISVGIENDMAFELFINNIKNKSKYSFNVEVNTNDKILTLSTCRDNSKKLIVHAKLIKSG